MEVTVLKCHSAQVRDLAEHVIAERGVKHGRVVMVPVELASEQHAHTDGAEQSQLHAHVR
jgi:CopG family nickel-responsive transcriptional regulator